jgi:hypothetical protein
VYIVSGFNRQTGQKKTGFSPFLDKFFSEVWVDLLGKPS